MEVNLNDSTKSDKPNTGGEPVNPNQAQALEIFQAAIKNLQKSGVSVRIMPLYDSGQTLMAVILDGVVVENGMMVCAAINGTEVV